MYVSIVCVCVCVCLCVCLSLVLLFFWGSTQSLPWAAAANNSLGCDSIPDYPICGKNPVDNLRKLCAWSYTTGLRSSGGTPAIISQVPSPWYYYYYYFPYHYHTTTITSTTATTTTSTLTLKCSMQNGHKWIYIIIVDDNFCIFQIQSCLDV